MPTLSPLSPSAPLSVVLVVVLTLSVWFDVSERRIPNWITGGGILGSLLARGFLGLGTLESGVLGGGLGLGLGLLLFASGAMGAGDGKLLAAVGSVLGFEVFVLCLPLIGAFGGLLALLMSARRGSLVPTLIRFRELLFFVVTFGRIGDRRTLDAPGAVSVPYGVAVAAGAVTAWLGWGVAL